jgi:tetratricopeptide (TPR) repeat protein
VSTRLISCALIAIALAGCSSATPRVAADRESVVVAPASAGDDAETAAEIPERALRSFERALAAMSAGDWTNAELELEQLVLDYPELPGPHVNLAIVYLESGRVDEARLALDRALELAPNHPAANNRLGMLLREAGEFAAAEAAYRRALAGDPDYALAHYNLGILLDLYLRRPTEALDEYHAYQRTLESPDEQIARWIVDLERRVNAAAERVARGDPQ